MPSNGLVYLVGAAGIHARGPSGASAHVRGLTAAFFGLGWEVRLVVATDHDHRGPAEAPEVPWFSAGRASWPSWLDRSRWGYLREVRTARRVAALARAVAPPHTGVVVERHTLYSDASRAVARSLGARRILEVNAPLALERARFETPPDRHAASRERRVLAEAPEITAVSRWLCRWLVEEVSCPADRVRHVPNGTAACRGDRAATRARLGLTDDDHLIGFVGSFKPWHGVGVLPHLLQGPFPRSHLLLVGAADPRPLAALGDRLHLAGQVAEAELAHLVAAMDVGLAPYPADAPPWFCPLKVLNYRAQGTPVVGTDVGDTAFLTGEGGSVVPPGDPDALVEAIRAWVGRRAPPHLRSWEDVALEMVGRPPL